MHIGNTEIFEPLDKLASDYSSIFILTDENSKEHCLPILQKNTAFARQALVFCVKSGEASKSLETAGQLWADLLAAGADRKSLLINLGGGMISDLGGFVASLYMRGIAFINIPTTLLSQIDASVGGKTGINLAEIKNLIGSFSLPERVLVHPPFLKTLPKRERLSGYAEMIKHGIIAGEAHFEAVSQFDPLSDTPDIQTISDSIALKNSIVTADPKEQGLRKVLNLGHSIGHAIESFSLYRDTSPLLHGEAVAAGIYYEAKLALQLALLDGTSFGRIENILLKHYHIPQFSQQEKELLLDYLQHDKKNSGKHLSFSLPKAIGEVVFDIFVERKQIEAVF